MATCINLRETFGTRFRIAYDPAYDAEHGERGRDDAPWLQIIPCQFGEIYPHGGERLGFASKRRGNIAMAVSRLPGAIIEQDASDGMNISFPVETFEQVAALVKPKRRRVLSPEQRERLIEAGKATRLRPGGGSPQIDQISRLEATVDINLDKALSVLKGGA